MESLDVSTIITEIIDNVCASASSKNEENFEGLKGIDEKTIIYQTDEVNRSPEAVEVLECDDNNTIKEVCGKDKIESSSSELTQSIEAEKELKQAKSPSDKINQSTEFVEGAIQPNFDGETQSPQAVEGLKDIDGKTINETSANERSDLKSTEADKELTQSESRSNPTEAIEGLKVIEDDMKDEVSGSVAIQSNFDGASHPTEPVEGEKDVDGKTINGGSGNDPIDSESASINETPESVELKQIKTDFDKDDQLTDTVEGSEGLVGEIIHRVNEGTLEEKKDLQKEATKSTDNTNKTASPRGTNPKTATKDVEVQFISSEILSSRGFSVNMFRNTREVGNLTLTSGQYTDCEIVCKGLPYDMIENELIPLFETVGPVFCLRMIKNFGTYVTYTISEDAEKAVTILHNRQLRGRRISIERVYPRVRLFIKPIPNRATKQQVFDEIKHHSNDLKKVYLFDDYEEPGKNRGFCYAEFENARAANYAKQMLSHIKIFGKNIICDWPDKEITVNSQQLYIHNLRPSIQARELRKIFSVYGEVSEIDKGGNFASILFRNADDAKRAANGVDKKLLGNENVEISFTTCKRSKPVYEDTPHNVYQKTVRYVREVIGPRSPHKNFTMSGPRRDASIPNSRGNITPSTHRGNVTPSSSRKDYSKSSQ